MVRVGRDLKDNRVPTPCHKQWGFTSYDDKSSLLCTIKNNSSLSLAFGQYLALEEIKAPSTSMLLWMLGKVLPQQHLSSLYSSQYLK